MERLELEVDNVMMDESGRYNLGTAMQIIDGKQRLDDCIFYLDVEGVALHLDKLTEKSFCYLHLHIM